MAGGEGEIEKRELGGGGGGFSMHTHKQGYEGLLSHSSDSQYCVAFLRYTVQEEIRTEGGNGFHLDLL